jgi:hypothetical protein
MVKGEVMVPVIQYHMIDVPSRASRVRGGFTPPGRFARQMRYLKAQGFEFYTAAELIDITTRNVGNSRRMELR